MRPIIGFEHNYPKKEPTRNLVINGKSISEDKFNRIMEDWEYLRNADVTSRVDPYDYLMQEVKK